MGTINLSFTNNKKSNKPQKLNKVFLTYYNSVKEIPEHYTYINENGTEVIFNDKTYNINKISSSKYIAQKSTVSKIPLTFIESKESIDFEPAYFTYDGNKRFLDKPYFDEESNSYKGILKITKVFDKEIKLYTHK